jgi:uncharacterized protein
LTTLLDVNVLIALLDQDHVFHEMAVNWFEAGARRDWATCPITENGAVRILGSPRYPMGPGDPVLVVDHLRRICTAGGHCFWEDSLSLLTTGRIDQRKLGASSSITDTYLLALAAEKQGRLATFDRKLATAAVRGGDAALLVIE